MNKHPIDCLIVGAGFAGITMAQQLSTRLGWKCTIVDARPHLGGNAYDTTDEYGVHIHPYGPHYFRTDSASVIDYLSQFTDWLPTEYRVLSFQGGKYWSFPINLKTFEQKMGCPCTEAEFQAWLDSVRVKFAHPPRNSQELMLTQVGEEWYNQFFAPYTQKQWGCPASELSPEVCGRIPIRTTADDSYLTAHFQALPAQGYTAMFHSMLTPIPTAPPVHVHLSTTWQQARQLFDYKHLIYTGPLDAYFDYSLGVLPYRSLRFVHHHHVGNVAFLAQPALQINYPSLDVLYTRRVELKHATRQQVQGTTVLEEYPEPYVQGKEPYYPIPSAKAEQLAVAYRALAAKEQSTTFVGRLATYRYLNMDQVVLDALSASEALISSLAQAKGREDSI